MKKIFPFALLFCLLQIFLTAQSAEKLRDDQQILANHLQAKQQQATPADPFQKLATAADRNFEPDVDNDGMPDDYEIAVNLNPNNPQDAFADPDGDGVLNLFEFQLGSSHDDASSPSVVNVVLGDNLKTKISAAADGTLLRLQGGVFPLNYISFTSPHPRIMLQGGWNANFSERDICKNETVLDGGLEDEIFYVGPSAGQNAIILDGLTFENGAGVFGSVKFISRNAVCRWSIVDCRFWKNIPTGNFGGALELLHWDTSKVDVTILNSTFTANEACAIYNQTSFKSQARWRVFNSTIALNRDILNPQIDYGLGIRGFTITDARLDIDMTNTILFGNDESDFKFNGHGDSVVVRMHRCDFSNTEFTAKSVLLPDADCLDEYPDFVDADVFDLDLAAGSPCLDAGLQVGLKFEGDAPDIGATRCLHSTSAQKLPGFAKKYQLKTFPNPTAEQATLEFFVEKSEKISLELADARGQVLKNLISEQEFSTGGHLLDFDLSDLPAGLHFFVFKNAASGELVALRFLKI